MTSLTYSCVVETQPKFVHQLWIWATTLIELAGASPNQILVHVLRGDYTGETLELLAERGIACEIIDRFGDGRYCNKLGQLRTPELRRTRYVAICDTDLAFCGPIDSIAPARAAAKPVDLPNPPLELLEEIYRRAGFDTFPARTRCSYDAAWTYANNCNGGLYVLDTTLIDALAARWERWALWTLEQNELLGAYVRHADQIAFGLATWESGEPVTPLPAAVNFPLHLPLERYDPACEAPAVLHYHDRLAPDGLLMPIGLPQVDERVRLVNDTLAADRRSRFHNGRFWDFRYAERPELGSGLGSRGRYVDRKRRILDEVIAPLAPASVLDVGCGDIEVTHELAIADYLGLDISTEAIRIARTRRPDWRFAVGDVLSAELPNADVIICLDVLIHEHDAARYGAVVARLAERARLALIVGAYNQEPWLTSSMTFFHEPIARTLHATGQFSAIEIVGGYRDTTVLLARR